MIMYEFFSQDSQKLPVISSVGYADNTLVTRYGPAVRNYYIIHYVLSGRGFYNGLPVEAGQGFIITPRTEAFYTYDEGDPWTYLWFTSYDDDILPFIEMHKAEDYVFSYRNREELLSVSDYIKRHGEKLSTSAQFSELFAKVFNICIWKKSSQVLCSKDHFNYAVKYIEMHLDQPINVNKLCELLGITQSYLHRIFKQEIGVSPKKYITQRKIRQAKRMLSESNASVTSIAGSLGFADAIAFTKFFKAQAGVSPTQFRQDFS